MKDPQNLQRITLQRITVAYNRSANGPGPFDVSEVNSRPGIGYFGQVDHPERADRFNWFCHHFTAPIMLVDVVFETFPGFRYGCLETGVLGFATGAMIDPPDFGGQPAIAIKFDGEHFVRRDDGHVLTRCRRLLLTPKGAYADLAEPAPQTERHVEHRIERVHAELASGR
ncbi:MAG TPA: hypothetical protein VK797_23480 [Tepidisphaeraceae bacterium]|jgi:hypothetical protein|nr:hypothetical protein [Tepidisphaeraceae bacterium]